MSETDTQIRLRRAKEAWEAAKETETTARRALATAMEETRRAKDRHEQLWLQNEAEEVSRRKLGYLHTTK